MACRQRGCKVKRNDERRRALERGLLACYEIIDRIRREMAELDAAKARKLGVAWLEAVIDAA